MAVDPGPEADSPMRRFWDERADENAYFFVDDRVAYGSPDVEEFWRRGIADLDAVLTPLEVRVEPDQLIVEIGCGVGRLTRGIAADAREVWAVDVSDRMLGLARRYNDDLGNVRWLLGDGVGLAGIPDAVADGIVSHVVFQHIPDPAITLGYVREMGRVLRPGGWAAFQISNDPNVHRPRRRGVRARLNVFGRGPQGQSRPEWLGSAVDLESLREAARSGGLDVERVVGQGTQFCLVRLRRGPRPPASQ